MVWCAVSSASPQSLLSGSSPRTLYFLLVFSEERPVICPSTFLRCALISFIAESVTACGVVGSLCLNPSSEMPGIQPSVPCPVEICILVTLYSFVALNPRKSYLVLKHLYFGDFWDDPKQVSSLPWYLVRILRQFDYEIMWMYLFINRILFHSYILTFCK